MRILITSGSTSEKIDAVRSITNRASGQLGSLIAQEFGSNQVNEIIYICNESAVKPTAKNLRIINITNHHSLETIILSILKNEKIDAVIHAMAVSDYTIDKVIAIDNENILNDNKISSNYDELLIRLKKTSKIIGLIKELSPETILVGFKLLVGVSEEELHKVGYNLLMKNNCNFVFANDLNKINREMHEGLLIASDGSYVKFKNKLAIAKGIVSSVLTSAKGTKK